MVDIWHEDWERLYESRRWRGDGVMRTPRLSGNAQYARLYQVDPRYWELKLRPEISNSGDLLAAELGEIEAFCDAHTVDSFYYKDVRDYVATEVLQSAGSSPWQLRRLRSYKALGNADTLTARYENAYHIITTARGGSAVVITDNGTPLTEGVNFSIDYDTGLVTWLGGYTPSGDVLASFEYYFKVRLTGPFGWTESDFSIADGKLVFEEVVGG